MGYSIKSSNQISVMGYCNLSFAKNLNVKYRRSFLIVLNNLPKMHLKLFEKEQFKKQQKQLVILLVKKLPIQRIQRRII